MNTPASDSRRTGSSTLRWVSLFLFLVTALIYLPVRQFPFVNFDDNDYVTDNSHVQSGLTSENVRWAFTHNAAANWHPLTWISHMLDCQLWKQNAGGHHLTNVLFHCANTVLLLLLLHGLTGSLWRSALVAALFAWHPLHVESVAWVSERKDVLSTLFGLLTIMAYVRYARQPRWQNYLLTTICFAAGLMCKPMLVSLPFILLLLDYWPLKRMSGARRHLILEKLPLFALSAASCVITFLVQESSGAVKSLERFSLFLRLANALVSYVRYLVKMIWPSDLAVFYPFPDRVAVGSIALAAMLLLTATTAVIVARRRYPFLLVGWFWYVLSLLPVIGLVQAGSQAMADRYTYVPLIGLFIMIAWALPALGTSRVGRVAVAGVIAGVLSLLIVGASRQLQYWQDDVVLFEHTVAVTGGSAVAHDCLGTAYLRKGKSSEAIEHYTKALQYNPSLAPAHNNLGYALFLQDRNDEAIAQYREALRLNPDLAEAHNNLATSLLKPGGYDEAAFQFREVLRLKPDFAEAYRGLGDALAAQGKGGDAIAQYTEALRLNPALPNARFNLANTFRAQGRMDQAIVQYEEALRLQPDDDEAHNNLGNCLLVQGRTDEAITHYQAAARLKPDSAEAHFNLAMALAKAGRFEEATGQGQTARTLALAANQTQLADQIAEHLKFYSAGLPFRK